MYNNHKYSNRYCNIARVIWVSSTCFSPLVPYFYVLLHVIWLYRTVWAKHTFIRFFSCMCPNVIEHSSSHSCMISTFEANKFGINISSRHIFACFTMIQKTRNWGVKIRVTVIAQQITWKRWKSNESNNNQMLESQRKINGIIKMSNWIFQSHFVNLTFF